MMVRVSCFAREGTLAILFSHMKTERLYYNDPYLFEFDARVVDAIDAAGGSGLILDRTAFYPTSGGQPNDLGTLGGIPLLDVYEDEASGAVVHVVPEPVSGPAV